MSAHVIRTSRRVAPALLAAGLGVLYLVVAPSGADLPAQLLRVRLFDVLGFSLWSNWWYGGHYLLSYSVLFPALASILTARLLGVLACVVTAAAFEALAHDAYGDGAWPGAVWLAAGTSVELLSGRLTFALGLSGVALTALALQRNRTWGAAMAATFTALSSPVAALFAALAGATVLIGGQRRSAGVAVIAAATTPVAALVIAFPQDGTQPFAFGTLWPLLVIAAALLLGLRRQERIVRTATALYAIGCLAAFLIPTAIGANAARLGELTAGPLVALLLCRPATPPDRRARRLAALALVAGPLLYLQIHDAVTDLEHGNSSPADSAAYYAPLIRYLASQPGAASHTFRVEVPFTAGHWEADRLAPSFPLARGWERQLDIADNPLFYEGRLTAARYRHWLAQMAVHYVAVADAPPDYSARAEVRLIKRGLPYLTLTARLTHWLVYRVRDPSPLASGVATVTRLAADSLSLAVRHSGTAYLRVRWSPYWQLSGVAGCVEPAGAFTRLSLRASGRARLSMSFSIGRIDAGSPRCNGDVITSPGGPTRSTG